MKRLAVALALWAGLAPAEVATRDAAGAVLRALDKVTGEVVDISMRIGTFARFGRLEIVLIECRYPVDNPAGDAFAALQIREQGREGEVFSGWMVASSPALSPMEHARYDVWVMRCQLPA